MTSLLKYDAACRAVAEAKTLDEVRDWEDKAAPFGNTRDEREIAASSSMPSKLGSAQGVAVANCFWH